MGFRVCIVQTDNGASKNKSKEIIKKLAFKEPLSHLKLPSFSLNNSRQIVRPEHFNKCFSAYSVGQHALE